MAVKTQAQLNAEIPTSFPDNTSGSITPLVMRSFQQDMSDTLFAGNLATLTITSPAPSATMIGANIGFTVSKGIDWSLLTFTGNVFSAAGAILSSAGALQLNPTAASTSLTISNQVAGTAFSVISASQDWGSANASNVMIVSSSYNDTNRILYRHAAGTQGFPSQTLATTTMGTISVRGYTNGGAFTANNVLNLLMVADDNFTSSATGSHWQFNTCPIGSATPAGTLQIGPGSVVTLAGGTAVPAGGTAGMGYLMSSTSNFGIFFGSSSPTLSAAKGSLYLRSDGTTTNNRAYINTDGGTTWTAITTAA